MEPSIKARHRSRSTHPSLKEAGKQQETKLFAFLAAAIGALSGALGCSPECPTGTTREGNICHVQRVQGDTASSGGAGANETAGTTVPVAMSGTSGSGTSMVAGRKPDGTVGGASAPAPQNGGSVASASAAATGGKGAGGVAAPATGNTGVAACPGGNMPGPEQCDAQDNDCDGQVDEDLTMPCGSSAQGVCRMGTKK